MTPVTACPSCQSHYPHRSCVAGASMAYGLIVKFFKDIQPNVIGNIHMPSHLFATLPECRAAAKSVARCLDRQGVEGVVQCVALSESVIPAPSDAYTPFHRE